MSLPFKTVPPGFVALTSTRQGGQSAPPYDSLNLGSNTDDQPSLVSANRHIFAKNLGLSSEQFVFMRQVHGDVIRQAGADDAGRGFDSWARGLEDCDGLMTAERGLALCVGHADCLAILMLDPQTGLMGVAHAGWRGAEMRIAAKLAQSFLGQSGADPKRFWVGLGPCLGPCHLELSEAQYRLFEKQAGHESFCTPLKDGHFNLDLWACVGRQLKDLGIPEQNIEIQRLCTACHPLEFFSHRRDQGKTGRMLSVMARS